MIYAPSGSKVAALLGFNLIIVLLRFNYFD